MTCVKTDLIDDAIAMVASALVQQAWQPRIRCVTTVEASDELGASSVGNLLVIARVGGSAFRSPFSLMKRVIAISDTPATAYGDAMINCGER